MVGEELLVLVEGDEACTTLSTVVRAFPPGEGYHGDLRMPAFAELPIMFVVQPAYHSLPNFGHGSFCPSANLRLSCVRVLATARRSEFVDGQR